MDFLPTPFYLEVVDIAVEEAAVEETEEADGRSGGGGAGGRW